MSIYRFEEAEFRRIELEEYPDDEFIVASLDFLGCNPNSHGIVITEEVFRRCAPSVLGKFLVAEVANGDATSHTEAEYIQGYIPREQEVRFVQNAYGDLRGVVDVVISKFYSSEFCDIFSDYDNKRSVSVEMFVEEEPMEDGHVMALDFNILAVTVLGQTIKPSSPTSNITITRFAEDGAEQYFKSVWHKLEETRKEKSMPEEKKEILEEVTPKDEELLEETSEEEVAPEEEEDVVMEETEENEETSEEEMSGCEEQEECSCEEEQCAEEETVEEECSCEEEQCSEEPAEEEQLEEPAEEAENFADRIAELEAIVASQTEELEALRAFKEAKDTEERNFAVNAVLAEVKDCLEEETFNTLKEEGFACKLEDVTAWSNKAKAMAYEAGTVRKSAKEKNFSVWSMSVPVKETKKSTSMWDNI